MNDTLVESFDVYDSAVLEDPFPAFERIRPVAPVLAMRRDDGPVTHMVTAHAPAVEVLEKPDIFSSDTHSLLTSGGAPNPEADAIYAKGWPEVPTMISTDGAAHQRFRNAIHYAFTVANVRDLTPLITTATDELIDGFIQDGACDFLERFAIPLPLYVISDVLGVDRALHLDLKRWSDAFILRNGKMGSREQEVQAARDILECQLFFNGLIEERRRTPAQDMISALVHSDGGVFSTAEILSILGMIVVGGNETTRSTLAGMMGRLLTAPAQAGMLRAEPRRLANAIDEALRYESPAASTWRIATRDTQLAGVSIPAGGILMLRLDAANRDPEAFPDPHVFDIERKNANRHVAFSRGPHFCIGQLLARRELAVAVPRLLERLEDLRLDEARTDLRNKPVLHVRSVRAVHLKFRPGRPLGTARG